MQSRISEVIAASDPVSVLTFVLECGLECCLLLSPGAPVVATALAYRVGSRDDPLPQAGIAHFLEHMMFRGSRRFGPGEIDRLTQKWGGSNNAFTSRDATVYHFEFGPQSWRHALAIEADRMTHLDLASEVIEAEREVVRDEIAMVEEDPWESLTREVQSVAFGSHPYAHPVLGDEHSLGAIDRSHLETFYRHFYRPTNGVLVVAGNLGAADRDSIEESFATVERCAAPVRMSVPQSPRLRRARVERRGGDVARMLLALPAPVARSSGFAGLLALSVLLTGGRGSRLVRRLVEEEQLCTWISADPLDLSEAGLFFVAAEVAPGVDPERVEERVLEEFAEIGSTAIASSELERVRNQLAVGWVFDHQLFAQRAVAAAQAMASFDLDFPRRQLLAALSYDEDRLRSLAREVVASENERVIGWSLP